MYVIIFYFIFAFSIQYNRLIVNVPFLRCYHTYFSKYLSFFIFYLSIVLYYKFSSLQLALVVSYFDVVSFYFAIFRDELFINRCKRQTLFQLRGIFNHIFKLQVIDLVFVESNHILFYLDLHLFKFFVSYVLYIPYTAAIIGLHRFFTQIVGSTLSLLSLASQILNAFIFFHLLLLNSPLYILQILL